MIDGSLEGGAETIAQVVLVGTIAGKFETAHCSAIQMFFKHPLGMLQAPCSQRYRIGTYLEKAAKF